MIQRSVLSRKVELSKRDFSIPSLVRGGNILIISV
jgi:hypothetical protein